ncbi:MAG: 50S ribosomal protein L6 [Gammaproteobacteria bacterium]|nr:50S ribosomal protein L6 [Gammaproteobacteria bacterium]MDE0280499.1 50S ribosomal protein L6 [Gammaproteobacteria bacterium]MDE0714147.1 50S ribosomal protein L6 [Gammaproteobacteria bacterium]MXY66677.1 50S ribosomal protein L6 [Gammaproteobacteria bacterium]MYG67623.1 50S ribosomal protein L6 [Gammaproteobacteria bacterium]
MSRIAKAPIPVPSGVEVKIEDGRFSAKGPKGELGVDLMNGISLVRDDDVLKVSVVDADRRTSKKLVAMSGTTRALVNNIITGVTSGFERVLNIMGVGYRAQVQGTRLNLTLGFSHPVVYDLPEGVTAETPNQTTIVLRSSDKQLLGQTAAEIRAFRPPEPYKGKGIRYRDEYVVRKQAKKK